MCVPGIKRTRYIANYVPSRRAMLIFHQKPLNCRTSRKIPAIFQFVKKTETISLLIVELLEMI